MTKKRLWNMFVLNYSLCLLRTGQQDDSRMNVAVALTAVRHGANVANHTEVLSLLKKKIVQG